MFGCVTSDQHDCFQFGSERCISMYSELSTSEQSSPKGKTLHKQICKDPSIRCIDQKGTDSLALEEKMAEDGFVTQQLRTQNGTIQGFFIAIGKDSKKQRRADKVLRQKSSWGECDRGNTNECEKFLKNDQSPFSTSFSSFSIPLNKNDRRNQAREKLCKSPKYRCVSSDKTKNLKPPQGWESLQTSTSTSITNGTNTTRTEAIWRKTP